MVYNTIPIEQSCEFINVSPTENPLISKCQIKVCYVQDTPNRNNTIITKEFARNELAQSLPGCPIVGFYNESEEDYEEHNEFITFKNNQITMGSDVTPIGFVDINPLIWFQKFIEEGNVVREYLVTEGYIWTEMIPESRRIIEKGNNQSMKLHEHSFEGQWVNLDNSDKQAFIFSKALIENLCVLGENYEPCFEGAQIKSTFSFDENTLNTLFNMAEELKETLNKGVNTHMNVKPLTVTGISDERVMNAYKHGVESNYSLYGLYETTDEVPQTFSVYTDTATNTMFKSEFTVVDNEFSFGDFEEVVGGVDVFGEVQFAAEDLEGAAKEDEDVNDEPIPDEPSPTASEVNPEPVPEPTPEPEPELEPTVEPVDNSPIGGEEPITGFSLTNEEVVKLIKDNEKLQLEFSKLKEDYDELLKFKHEIEKEKKLQVIDSFSMVDETYKAGILEKLDEYTPEQVEADLAVYCYRNKINFSLDSDEVHEEDKPNITFMIDEQAESDVPEWFKKAQEIDKHSF